MEEPPVPFSSPPSSTRAPLQRGVKLDRSNPKQEHLCIDVESHVSQLEPVALQPICCRHQRRLRRSDLVACAISRMRSTGTTFFMMSVLSAGLGSRSARSAREQQEHSMCLAPKAVRVACRLLRRGLTFVVLVSGGYKCSEATQVSSPVAGMAIGGPLTRAATSRPTHSPLV